MARGALAAGVACLALAPAAPALAHGMGEQVMLHPGLPAAWLALIGAMVAAIAAWALAAHVPQDVQARTVNLAALPVVGPLVRFLNRSPYPLLGMRFLSVAAMLVVIAAGFFGNASPERNFATSFVWTIWWPLVVVSVLFVGSAWCAVCPWDTLATWLVRRRWWRRVKPHPGLNRKVPPVMRHVWIALLMFVVLTWLEFGAGVTTIPFMTALLAVLMVVLSVGFLLVFERKAFCRYACPVGRTLGLYSRLAPVAVRPLKQATCDRCETMECYNGSSQIEPCPTNLTVGRFNQNTFCLSCGNCVLSCPHQNVSWRLRTMGSEAREQAVPPWDAAWFMLVLVGITSFHGLTMIPRWNDWVMAIARSTGEMGDLYVSFTLGMLGSVALPVLLYAAAIGLLCLGAARPARYARLFAGFSFTGLPLAFAYHLAHNMDHLLREGTGVLPLFTNPFGTGLAAMGGAERHAQMMNPLLPETAMFAVQAALMVLGFWLAAQIARYQERRLLPELQAGAGWRRLPILLFIAAVTAQNLWLMAQDMEMRF